VTCENQRRADKCIPVLLEFPFKHKRIMCAPLIGKVSVERYLGSGQIEQVICGGENYDGARPCDFEWVKGLRRACARKVVESDIILLINGKWHSCGKQECHTILNKGSWYD